MAKSVLKGITIEIGGNTTNLTKSIDDVNKKSRSLQSELKEVNKLLKLDPKNTELVAQKQKLLAESVNQTKEKLNVLKEAEKQVQTQFEKGEASEEQYREIQREIVQTEQDLKSLKKQTEEFNNQKLDNVAEGFKKTGEKISGVGEKLMPVTGAVTAVGAASLAACMNMDNGYDTVITKTGATGEALDGLKKNVDNVFKDLPVSAEDAGIAVGEVNTRFGQTGETCEKTSKQFLEFANINGTDLNTAIDSADAIMTKFGVDSSQTGNVLGLLTKAEQDTGLSMDTLQNTLQKNGATLKEMGLDVTSSVNLLAQFESSGVDATAAMAGLKKAQQNATAEGKTLKDALSETVEKIKGASSETEALQIATDLFGKKGAAEMTQAIREGRFSLDDLTGSLNDYSNTVEDTYTATLDPWDQAKVMINNVQLAGSDLAGTVLSALQPAIDGTTEKIKGFTSWFTSLDSGTKEMIATIALVVAAVGPVLIIIGKLCTAVSSIINIAKLLQPVIVAINTTLAANPIMIVIMAVAALIAIFVTLYNKCEWFRDAVNSVFEAIKSFLEPVIEAIKGFIETIWTKIQEIWALIEPYIMAAVGTLRQIGSDIAQIFSDCWSIIQSVWNLVSPYFEAIWENIKVIFSVVGTVLSGFFDVAWTAIKGIWDVAVLYFTLIWENIKAVFSVVGEVLGSFFRNAWNIIKAVWDVVVAYFSAIWNAIKGVFAVVKDVLSGDFKGAWNEIKNIFSGFANYFKTLWNAVKTIFSSVGSFFKDTFGAAWNGVKAVFSNFGSFFSGLWNTIKNTFTRLGTSIAGAISGSVKAGINGVISMIQNTINGAIGLINGAIGLINKIPGVSISKIRKLSLPKLAKGGELQEGQAIVAEAGPEILQVVNGKTIVTPLTDGAKNRTLDEALGKRGTGDTKVEMKIENFYNNRKQDIRELTEEVLEVAAQIKERDEAAYA